MKNILTGLYFLILLVAVLLAILLLTNNTALIGLEQGPALRNAVLILTVAGLVLGRVIRHLKNKEE